MERELLRISARCDRWAPGTVRKAIATLPQAGQSWVMGDAMLVASELVSNAVRHSNCNEDDMLIVTVRQASDRLEVSVCDPGASGAEAVPSEAGPAGGGLGLKVVEALSACWGSERRPKGYRTWARLPVLA
jgi:serine/threonine-protein kinase RsbW